MVEKRSEVFLPKKREFIIVMSFRIALAKNNLFANKLITTAVFAPISLRSRRVSNNFRVFFSFEAFTLLFVCVCYFDEDGKKNVVVGFVNDHTTGEFHVQ